MSGNAFRFDRAILEKPIRFGVYGGLGCLVVALVLGELFLYLLMPDKQEAAAKQQPPPQQGAQVDIFFVLDVTKSMQDAIDGVRDGIVSFAGELDKKGHDPRVGLLAFRDLREREPEDLLLFDDGPFTKDYKRFSSKVGQLKASGGGDIPESSLEALATASKQPFRKDAVKVIVLITDAPPHNPDEQGRNPEEIGALLKSASIDSLHLVVERSDRKIFERVQNAVGGKYFSLSEAAQGKTNYDSILPEISQQIAETVGAKQPAAKSLQSNEDFKPQSNARLLFAVAFWTALLAVGIALALIVGQNHYLKRNLLSQQEGLRGGLGAAACGLVAGFIGQGFFQLAESNSSFIIGLSRVIGWSILGALLGLGMSFFVKNLRLNLAAAGGAVGGLFGASFFMIASAIFGDVLGRLFGAFLLGFGIGMMVALVEIAFRKAWLEVRYSPREVIAVNLGPEPIKVGGDGKACTVWARGATAVAYRFWIREGKVVCEDVASGGTREVDNGSSYQAGSVEVIVRTSGSPVPARGPLPPPPVLPPKPAAPHPNPKELRSSVPPAPVAPPPPPAPKPETATQAKPPAPRTSDGCPSCGRKIPGMTGQRYCMVCDHTF